MTEIFKPNSNDRSMISNVKINLRDLTENQKRKNSIYTNNIKINLRDLTKNPKRKNSIYTNNIYSHTQVTCAEINYIIQIHIYIYRWYVV
jgi:hypothetical protein